MECSVHKSAFSLVCVTCEDKLLCVQCVDTHTMGHHYKSLVAVTQRVKSEKQNLLRNIDEDVTTLKKEIAAVRATQKQQEDLEKEENQKINDHRAAFYSIIDEIADEQLRFSGTQKKKNISVLQEDEVSLNKQLQQRLEYGNTIKDTLESSDDRHMLLKAKTFTPATPLSFPPTPLEPLKFCAGHINKDQIRFMFGRMTNSPDEAEVVSDFVGSIRKRSPDTEASQDKALSSTRTVNPEKHVSKKGSVQLERKEQRTPVDHSTWLLSQDLERSKNSATERMDTDGFYPFDNMGVDVVCGDITSIPADAVVSPEDIHCSGQGQIARAIMDKAGKSFESLDKTVVQRKQKLSVMDVFPTHAGDARWNHILHTIVPVWKNYNKNSEKFRQDVKATYLNIFNKMETLNIQDIAVPVIGADSSSVPVTVLAEGLYSACKEYSKVSKQRYLKIIITSVYIKLVNGLCDTMNNLEGGKTADGSTSIKQSGGTQETCCICMDEVTDPKTLRCGHVFCKDCIEQCFEFKPMCPNCGAIYGKIIGDQPDGTITITKSRYEHLPGYEKDGVITVSYFFTGGVQGENHPNPGRQYEGIARSGYLPNNKRGILVSKLLEIAFNRKLVFTIGSSRTTGKEGVVTWNNIHHKTRKDGGPQRFGYPDHTYLDRVMEELAVEGVTEESLDDP